jgi:hypothetical protein
MPFQKGNPGGPGRPPKAVEDAKQSVLLELFDEGTERAIVANMIANAKRKGVLAAPSATAAATWLWDRKYGKVKDQIEQSGGLTIRVVYADDPAHTP